MHWYKAIRQHGHLVMVYINIFLPILQCRGVHVYHDYAKVLQLRMNNLAAS